MQSEHQMVKAVYAAKNDYDKADELIRDYIPFILAKASDALSRFCHEQDDEFSIALLAFHEAILSYQKEKGSFLNYAALLIKNRIIDYRRKEYRHEGHLSIHQEVNEDGKTILDTYADPKNPVDENIRFEATKDEIEELSIVMKEFGVSFNDVADNSPKQERTLVACAKVIQYAAENKYLLDELLRTKKIPMAQLVLATGVERKTLERHRKYILVMLLAQTNGYEIIREHIRFLFKKRGGNF